MIYRNKGDKRGSELRRLWEVETFDGDPDDPATLTVKRTVIAWNAVDANRHAGGRVASEPKPLYFVTWPEFEGGPVYRIDNPNDGPLVDEGPVVPSIVRAGPDDEEW
jgi:hypothetical protein